MTRIVATANVKDAEPDNLEHYLEMLQSPEIAEAMEKNGVIRDSVKFYILDKQLRA